MSGGGGGSGGSELDRLSQTYFLHVLSRIEQNFKPPFSRQAECRVRFYIQKNGAITDIRLAKTSGNSVLDQYAVRALEITARVPEPYDSFKENYLDVVVNFSFERKR